MFYDKQTKEIKKGGILEYLWSLGDETMKSVIDLMIEKGLIKREGSRLINCSAFGEEVTFELNEIEEEMRENEQYK